MTVRIAAHPKTTLAEFLAWAPPDDRRYELIDGRITAMNPLSWTHSVLLIALGAELRARLPSRPDCSIGGEAGVILPFSDYDYYQADIVIRCRGKEHQQKDEPVPVVIVEILSPSTDDHERAEKLPNYQNIPSVREIVLLHQTRAFAEVYRRGPDSYWRIDFVRGLIQELSLRIAIPLADIYRGLPPGVPSDQPPPSPPAW